MEPTPSQNPTRDSHSTGPKRRRTVRVPSQEVPIGGRSLVQSEGTQIALFRLDSGALHAVDNQCPHEGYPLIKGTVKDCILTCPWHNFKFRLDDGSCLKGDEAVRTFPVREADGSIEVEILEPPVAEEISRTMRSLEGGLHENRMAQVARDTVRLLKLGMAPREIALLACRYDAEHAEFGTTHAMPVAVDILSYFKRYPGVEAVYPLMQALELCGEDHVRRPLRSTPEPVDPGPDPEVAGSRLAAHIENEEVAAAEALLRGALARGWGREIIEPWLYAACARHFLGFGHPLIYQVKIFDLLEVVGWEHAVELLPAFLLRIIYSTREDLLPEWSWFRGRLQQIEARLPELYALQPHGISLTSAPQLTEALLDGDRESAFDALTHALEHPVPLTALVNAMSLAAAERLRRFDVRIDCDRSVQDGWLDVTHLLTYVNALRHAVARYRHPEVLRLLYFGVRFIHNARSLDTSEPERIRIQPDPTSGENLEVLAHRLQSRDAGGAIQALRNCLHHEPIGKLRAFFEDLVFAESLTRPIVVAHLIKMCAAAFEEFEALQQSQESDAAAPIEALTRLAASPIQERRVSRSSYEAIRFIVQGKVPRSLT